MSETAKKQAEKVTPSPLEPQVGAEVMALHTELTTIFEHPWRLDLTHYLDGLPSIHVEVHPPFDDLFMYDDRVIACCENHMPAGYYFDGTGSACQKREDGSGERDYYIYPVKRTE